MIYRLVTFPMRIPFKIIKWIVIIVFLIIVAVMWGKFKKKKQGFMDNFGLFGNNGLLKREGFSSLDEDEDEDDGQQDVYLD